MAQYVDSAIQSFKYRNPTLNDHLVLAGEAYNVIKKSQFFKPPRLCEGESPKQTVTFISVNQIPVICPSVITEIMDCFARLMQPRNDDLHLLS